MSKTFYFLQKIDKNFNVSFSFSSILDCFMLSRFWVFGFVSGCSPEAPQKAFCQKIVPKKCCPKTRNRNYFFSNFIIFITCLVFGRFSRGARGVRKDHRHFLPKKVNNDLAL
jgi:hypothetical protein